MSDEEDLTYGGAKPGRETPYDRPTWAGLFGAAPGINLTGHDEEYAAGSGLRQVWCIAYDSDTPNMDGSHNAVRMHEVTSLEAVQSALQIVRDRSLRAPKQNLRIETRFVSEWTVISPVSGTDDE